MKVKEYVITAEEYEAAEKTLAEYEAFRANTQKFLTAIREHGIQVEAPRNFLFDGFDSVSATSSMMGTGMRIQVHNYKKK